MKPRIHAQLVNDPFGDPGLYLDFLFERRAMLFDLGDIAALPTRKILRLGHVFVSHAHMDHFAGFDRLLRICLGRDKTLALFGPPGFVERVEHKLRAYTWNRIPDYPGDFVLEVAEMDEGPAARGARARFRSRRAFAREDDAAGGFSEGVLLAAEGVRVKATLLDHDTPCLAFALEEETHVNVWKNRLEARGLAVGPWLNELKAAVRAGVPDDAPIRCRRAGGDVVELPLGELEESVLSLVPGQKIAYVVDVRYGEDNARRIERLAGEADLLFIEAVFLDEDRALAAERFHLTARQAGELARRARVKRAVPFHFSPRYVERAEELGREFAAAFGGLIADEATPSR